LQDLAAAGLEGCEKVFDMGVGGSGVVFLGEMLYLLDDSRCQSKLVFASEREIVRERLARRMWKTPWLLGLNSELPCR
jgi:hypothetical protein